MIRSSRHSATYIEFERQGDNCRRPSIPNANTIPGFCHVICDLTDPMKEICSLKHDLSVTSDSMGFFAASRGITTPMWRSITTVL